MNTQKEQIETLKSMASEGYEAARELAELNLRVWNQLYEKQSDMINLWFQTGISQLELNSSASDPKEYLAAQTALTKELGEKLIASGRETLSASSQMQGEYRAWYEQSVQSLAKNWNLASKQSS